VATKPDDSKGSSQQSNTLAEEEVKLESYRRNLWSQCHLDSVMVSSLREILIEVAAIGEDGRPLPSHGLLTKSNFLEILERLYLEETEANVALYEYHLNESAGAQVESFFSGILFLCQGEAIEKLEMAFDLWIGAGEERMEAVRMTRLLRHMLWTCKELQTEEGSHRYERDRNVRVRVKS